MIVTDRRQPVAVLKALEDGECNVSVEERLAYLAREGGLRLGEPSRRLETWKAVRVPASAFVTFE